jgi:hypothetical protein
LHEDDNVFVSIKTSTNYNHHIMATLEATIDNKIKPIILLVIKNSNYNNNNEIEE